MAPENTTTNKRRLPAEAEPYKWKSGQSGNPGGRPKKKPITELYEEILNDPEAIEMVRKAVIKSLGRGQMAMVLQLREMTDRVEGKVSQPVEVEGTLAIQTLSERMQKARERASGGS